MNKSRTKKLIEAVDKINEQNEQIKKIKTEGANAEEVLASIRKNN